MAHMKKSIGVFLTCYSLTIFATTSTVYFNGDILTMEGDAPNYVESVLVQDNKITYAGAVKDVLARAGSNPTFYDLKGHTLMPGFIDTWGHFTLVAQDMLAVNLAYFSKAPPKTKVDLIEKLRHEGKPFNGWIVGTGYAPTMITGGQLTLADLDKAFPTQPVLIANISTLEGLVNSAGLKKLGITKNTKATAGYIVVDPKTCALTGEIVGNPFFDAVSKAVGSYSQDQMFETYRQAEKVYTSNGFTTVQSYQASPVDIDNMRQAVAKGIVKVDLIALPYFNVVDQLLKADPHYPFGLYSQGDRGFKVAGMLMPTDGGPQLRIAYFTQPYQDTSGYSKDWRGMALYPQSLIDHYAKLAYQNNIQYFAYSNGDAGIDMTLAALNKAINETGVKDDRRTVIAHSYFSRDDQLVQYKDKHIMMLTLPNQVWLYGDLYLKILGENRASNMAPLAAAQKYGVKTGLHNDSPGSGPNVFFTIWSAVNRKTYSGVALGPDQRIDPYLALQGVTSNAAYEYKEEAIKGTITAGKVADLIELDRNPLKVDPDSIKDVRVLQTIKGGKQLYVNGL